MRPYGVSANLVRRAGEDTRPYGDSANQSRRAHTVRPYGGSADLVRRARNVRSYGGNGTGHGANPPETTCPARGG